MKQWSWRSTKESIQAFCANHPLLLTFFIVICISLITVPFTLIDGFYDRDFLKGLLENAHVLIFDLIIVGIISLFFNSLGERQKKNIRYQEEIIDFLDWEADEAKIRIVANIKRLNRLGITRINLGGAFLRDANLCLVNFEGADLGGACLEGADLSGANLRSTNLQGAHLQEAYFMSTELEGADLRYAQLGDNLVGVPLNQLVGGFWDNDDNKMVLTAYVEKDDYHQGVIIIPKGKKELALRISYNDKTKWPNGFTPPPTTYNYKITRT